MATPLLGSVAENNAFPLDTTAVQIGNEIKVVLTTIDLNKPVDISQLDNYEVLLQRVDSIHCKAFGRETGIRIEKSGDGKTFRLVYDYNPSSHLALLMTVIGNDVQDIILMSIVTEHKGQQSDVGAGAGAGAGAGQVNDHITIWSVAKNPAIDFQNAFGVYLEKLKEIDEFSGYTIFKLQVDPSNTLRMTEQGRIRLYASLGFNIDTGTALETIYPEGIFYFIKHAEGNVGQVYLMSYADLDEKCEFIGNIKSHQRNPIPMTSTREELGVYRDIYCGLKESFKGNKIPGPYNETNIKEINPPFPVLKNSNVDKSALLQSIAPSSTTTTTSSSSTTTTTSSSAPPFTVLKMSYHMTLVKNILNKLNYVDFCEVPDDFIVISLTSPGSLLRQYTPMNFDDYMLKILPYMQDSLIFKHLLETHCSTATLPLYNIQEHDELVENTTRVPSQADPNLFHRQLYRSILNSIIMDSMGRQPIFEIPVEETRQLVLPGSGQRVKKEQYDIQIYTPGMRMFDYVIARQSLYQAEGRKAMNEEQAKFDDYLLSGTFKLTKDERGQFSTSTQIDDSPFVNNTKGMFSDYFNFIRATVPKIQGEKYILFAFGCAPLTIPGRELPLYELLYELSHRRSIVHTFPTGTRVDSDQFIGTAVFNKHILTEHDCSKLDQKEAAERNNLREHLISITVDMHTGDDDVNPNAYSNPYEFYNQLTEMSSTPSTVVRKSARPAKSAKSARSARSTSRLRPTTTSSTTTATTTSSSSSSYSPATTATTTTSSSSSAPSAPSSSTFGAGSGPFYGSRRKGGGKQKKRLAKTKRASSRKMATRFRRLRTRKLRKTKGLKTRKMKKGEYNF